MLSYERWFPNSWAKLMNTCWRGTSLKLNSAGKPCVLNTHKVDNTDRSTCQINLQHESYLLLARNEASDAMLLRSASCRHLAACAGTSLNSLWRGATYAILECVWSMLKKKTCHRCPRDFICLALCKRSLQLISVLAAQRQSLDADTVALSTCSCVADT